MSKSLVHKVTHSSHNRSSPRPPPVPHAMAPSQTSELAASGPVSSMQDLVAAIELLSRVDVPLDSRADAATLVASELSAGEKDYREMGEVCRVLCERFSVDGVLRLDEGREREREGVVSATADAGLEKYVQYHSEMIKIIALLQVSFPDTLMECFPPAASYLIESSHSHQIPIVTSSCLYWAGLHFHPIYANPKFGEKWKSALRGDLPRLIHALLTSMIYRDPHVAYLEQNPVDRLGGPENKLTERAKVDPPTGEVAAMSDLRNLAALAFENVCRAFGDEAVLAFRPRLCEMLMGGGSGGGGGAAQEDWKRKDAAILGLTALTKALGSTALLDDVYQQVMTTILACYEDEKPLLRSVACFAVPYFMDTKFPAGVEDPMPRAISKTLVLLTDPYIEVRCIAIRSLGTFIAFSKADLEPLIPSIVDSLVKADAAMFGECRCPYFDCIGHLCGRAGSSLSPFDFDRVISPLLTHWQRVEALDDVCYNDDEDDDDDEEDVDIVTLCQALCTVSYHSGKSFTPYVEAMFSKASQQMRRVLDTYLAGEQALAKWEAGCKAKIDRESGDQMGIEATGEKTGKEAGNKMRLMDQLPSAEDLGVKILPRELVICYMVGCLDVLSAVFDGLGSVVAPYSKKYRIPEILMQTLKVDQFHKCIHQSALALLGHVVRNHESQNGGEAAESSDLPTPDDFTDLVIDVIKSSCAGVAVRSGEHSETASSGGELGQTSGGKTCTAIEHKKPTKSSQSDKTVQLKKSSSGAAKNEKEKPVKKDDKPATEGSGGEKHDSTLSLTEEMEQMSLDATAKSGNSSGESSPSSSIGRLGYHEELYCNALWALVFISKNPSTNHTKLFTVVDELIETLEDTSGHMGCVINAAWALTSICSQHPEITSTVVLRKDVFLHIAGLLQNRFPRPELEQTDIFRNFATMLTPVVGKIKPPGMWGPVLLAAATAAEIEDAAMHKDVRRLLNEVQGSLGAKEWKELIRDLSPAVAGRLRHKFDIS